MLDKLYLHEGANQSISNGRLIDLCYTISTNLTKLYTIYNHCYCCVIFNIQYSKTSNTFATSKEILCFFEKCISFLGEFTVL